ncbi:e3 ubiquitin-protein ligase UHRF1 [Caerostris darwini]|uniref:E3 ubiquitin-protein ligase UHRF1 n=1 Tax=Caerostris darwini TaxID=1538125 RepID=A0AAV4S4A1_9ARAC|nr:e3 ubiquitin-protein ligase UHRF1 [Caerostris darwini]
MDYLELVKKQKQENLERLESLGILNLRKSYRNDLNQSPSKKSLKGVGKSSKPKFKASEVLPRRRSGRLLQKEPSNYLEENIDYFNESKRSSPNKHIYIKRENVFGAIPGVPVGTIFLTRMEASRAGIHRPPISGIHGNPAVGCYSLALSGGYEDDEDLGDTFIYTGEGGRDLKGTKANPKNLRTAPQSKDQVLQKGNLALSKNVENNLPVRVLRGYKLRSNFAPEEGYRYDGLYKVVNYYITTGLSGFKVFKFHMERIEDQEPSPWADNFKIKTSDNVTSSVDKENISNDEDEDQQTNDENEDQQTNDENEDQLQKM